MSNSTISLHPKGRKKEEIKKSGLKSQGNISGVGVTPPDSIEEIQNLCHHNGIEYGGREYIP
jgi:hypothetical protein